MKALRLLTIAAALMLFVPAGAFENETESTAPAVVRRPKVGVVLSGGGALGAAHIGVLKFLEENGIQADCIVGTSMGAIIGGMYAAGYKANEIDSIIRAQDWDFLMNDRIPRNEISFEEKQFKDTYLANIPFTLSLSDFRSKKEEDDPMLIGPLPEPEPKRQKSFLDNIPMSFVRGQNVYNLFSKLTVGYQDSIDFNNLPIPYSCVAVDLISGKEIHFHNGRLVDAIRSSMSIPGYFEPVRYDDMILIDGGALNNFPVDVARSMGADYIIGVVLSRSDRKPEVPDVHNAGDIFSRIYSLYTKQKMPELLEDTDILIEVDTKGYTVLGFSDENISDLIANGYSAAKDHQEQIQNLQNYIKHCEYQAERSVMGPKKAAPGTRRPAINIERDSILIGSVRYHGLDDNTARILLRNSTLQDDSYLTGAEIDEAVKQFYGTMAFNSVTYRITGSSEPYDLDIYFEPGHNCEIGIGAFIDNEEVSVVKFHVGVNSKALYGSSLDLSGRVSINPIVRLRYSYSFPSHVRFNTELLYRGAYGSLIYNDAQQRLNMHGFGARMYVCSRKYNNIYTEAGISVSRFMLADAMDWVNVDWGEESAHSFAGAFVRGHFNSLNDEYFPTSGTDLEIGARYQSNLFYKKTHSPYSILHLNWKSALSIGDRLTFIPSLNFRYLLGSDIPFADSNIMGGYLPGRYMDHQVPFVGFRDAIVMNQLMNVASLDARVRMGDKHYLIASGCYALDAATIHDLFNSPRGIFGVRAGYSYNSVIGPLSFNMHWSNLFNSPGVYISLGYNL